ncbi:hypothetical protein [Amycolatopsis magusensis]|uniref:hypothetical protein n=1 Tax=Amycolatopsis magusensis TaxID=882444 RepID=UPI003C2E3DC8
MEVAVPDGDYIAWHAAAKWRKLANLMRSGASTIEVEDAAASAAAKTIRSIGGLPDFTAEAQRVCAVAAGNEGAAWTGRSSTGNGLMNQLVNASVDALAAKLQKSMRLVSPTEAASLLARQIIGRVIVAGVDHAVPTLIGEGHYTAGELQTAMRQMIDSTPMKDLATRWVAHPTGAGLQAPKRRTPAKPMDELLGTALDEL